MITINSVVSYAKNLISRARNIKKPYAIVIIAVVLLVAAGVYSRAGKTPTNYEFAVAKRQSVLQEVSVTGRVKSAQSVDLAFERGGKVVKIFVDIGANVDAEQELLQLDNAEIGAQLAQAQADVKIQQAKLDELVAGTRPEELDIQKVKVANAESSLQGANRNMVDKLQDAYTKSDDAIRNRADRFFTNPTTFNAILNLFGLPDEDKGNIVLKRIYIETLLKSWQASVANLNVNSDFGAYINDSKQKLSQIKDFLDLLSLAINNPSVSLSSGGSTISIPDSWKTEVATGRTSVNAAINNITLADGELQTAKSNLALAQQQLVLGRAGSTPEEIAAQEAQVEKSKSNAENYRVQFEKTILRSPIKGVVTNVVPKIGELVLGNSNVVSLLSEAQFQIEANIPEVDIAKIKVGDTAKVTLDAYGRDVEFSATVSAIDPAETMIEGVATYKTTLTLVQDSRIKSGMTANVDILGARRDDVIVIPQRAVIRKDGEESARLLRKNKVVEVSIRTGLRGSDGNIEVSEGIKEGDKVITYVTPKNN